MVAPRSVRLARWLGKEWLLMLFASLALLFALVDPQPWGRYLDWLQLPTLAGLAGLLIALQGVRDSGLVQRMATALLVRMHSLRALGLLLVACTAVLSMVLTNDVSLFLLVPLTLAIGTLSNLPVLRMVILEALAVNAGSALSPIGNPQNLLLWQSSHLPFFHFVLGMLPAAATMFALVALLTLLWLPAEKVTLQRQKLGGDAVSVPLATLSLLALVGMVVTMEYGLAPAGALVLLAVFAVAARDSLRRIDWPLLLTFAAIFLALGHFARLPPVHDALDRLDFGRPLTLYLAGVIASQLISNVPATVLLLERASDPIALAVAVNVGGFGVVIGSLANLIALRLARQDGGLAQFHRVSVPFLLVCAPAAWLAWRLLG